MTHSLLVVEGPHDASFFGHLLKRRGYRQVERKGEVPPLWLPLIPEKYPVDPEGRLGNIISFPYIYGDAEENTFGVAVAGSDSQIVTELRGCLESLSVNRLTGIGIVVDADRGTSVPDRFRTYTDRLTQLNKDAAAEGVPGFPIHIPQQPGVVLAGPPKIGIHLFPDNAAPGALETILLDCADTNVGRLRRCASEVISYIDKRNPENDRDLKKLRAASGRDKAAAGIVANLLAPGASLAASLRSDAWLRGEALKHPWVIAADNFLAQLI